MDFLQVLYECNGIDIPNKLVNVIALVITVIKFGVPVLLIIFGMLDLGKAVVASKEDEIKKGQQMFIKRVIAAVLVFFVITVVQLVVSLVSSDGDSTVWDCVHTFTCGVDDNGNSKCSPRD